MNGPLLLLDPGHGGSAAAGASSPNRGVGSNGLLEKDVALDLARRTRERLVPDHVVILTRDSDSNLSLAARAEAAKKLQAAVFVSIHFSGGDPAADRTDAVVATNASPVSRRLADAVRTGIAAVTGASGSVLEADLGQLAADRHDPATAACLIEVASLAPPSRAALLTDPAYRDRLADALATAIRQSVAAPALATPQWVGARYGRTAAIYPPQVDLSYDPLDLVAAAAAWAQWGARRISWEVGVPDAALTRFPHAAVCQLKMTGANGDVFYGTGFYIADEVLLSCGHNFFGADGYRAVRVEVQPGFSPTSSVLASRAFDIDGSAIVHPRWRTDADDGYDLSVLRVPGLPATAGAFRLANVSLAPDQQIVVCGYGKTDGVDSDAQPQRMDGALIARADFDLIHYPMMTMGGHSGSPVFHGAMVIGVHTGGRSDLQLNEAVLLTPEKEDWIVAQAGGGVSFGQGVRSSRTLTDQSSPQREQSNQVLVDVALSVGRAEASMRYHLVHDDSGRINFGIGSWTGTRIADVLDTYAAFAAESGLTDQMTAHCGGQSGFDAIRTAFRTSGTATTLTPAQRAQLTALGRDTALQPAQDRHLAQDIRTDLAAIGSDGPPWYPYIDSYMNAISEIAAHVLVHARHQSGGAGLRTRLAEVVAGFGGEAALGQGMVTGTITERMVLERIGEAVATHTNAPDAVRARYQRLFTDWGSSTLSYYFSPAL